MIIWGSKGKSKTVETGRFFCPICKSQQRYNHEVIGKYFTLYFIPLFRTKKVGEYIECQNCHMTFKPEIIDWSKGRSQAQADIKEITQELRHELEAGMPIQSIVYALTEKGIDKDITGRLIVEATDNRISSCSRCSMDYINSLSYCPQCGEKLQPNRY